MRQILSAYSGTVQAGFNEYMLYGGLPQILSYDSEEQKVCFLKTLFDETYIKDIKDRHDIRKDDDLEELVNIMASDVGALTNPNKLANCGGPIVMRNKEGKQQRSNLEVDFICNLGSRQKGYHYWRRKPYYQR